MHRFTLLALAALLASAPSLARAGDRIDVMTQNQYLGADLNPIIAAPDPIAFNAAVLTALSEIAANDFPTRAQLLAALIAKRRPDVVGLQEVFSFGCIPIAPPPPSGGCNDPAIAGAFNDHLALTLAALAAEGEVYTAAAVVDDLDLTSPGIPVDTDGNLLPDILVTVLDRDVILARSGVTATPVDYSAFCPGRTSADGCNYLIVAEANTAVGIIRQERGWVGVDVTIDAKAYRIVDTHLEVQNPDPSNPLSPAVQAAQAQELITVLGLSTPPGRSLIVVGDINSSPEDPILTSPFLIVPPYTQFVGSGYTDAWDLRPGAVPGYSCCQLSDLSNHQSILDERIDTIFSTEVPTMVNKARTLGDRVSDKSGPFDLWPSDHATVAAELEFD
jgi:endonuclease/exonuclease/phosphatase family metal-dependent hydrolase